jgi:hypothetical protein
MGGSVDIAQARLFDTMAGQGHLFLWGRARYSDVFSSTRNHVTEVCFKVTVEGQKGPPFKGNVLFAFYGENNRQYDA